MTVEQLIEKLKTMNPTATVAVERLFDDGTEQWWGATFGIDVTPVVDDTYVLITVED